jgi:hypothetical protein
LSFSCLYVVAPEHSINAFSFLLTSFAYTCSYSICLVSMKYGCGMENTDDVGRAYDQAWISRPVAASKLPTTQHNNEYLN